MSNTVIVSPNHSLLWTITLQNPKIQMSFSRHFSFSFVLFSVALSAALSGQTEDILEVYEYPDVIVAPTTVYDGDDAYTTETKRSERYSVSVSNGDQTFDAYVMHSPNVKKTGNLALSPDNHWTNFSSSGHVTVTITNLNGAIKTCELLPRKKGYTANVQGNHATFTIESNASDPPLQIYARINEDPRHALLIFVDPPETDVPDRNDSRNVETIRVGDSIEVVHSKLTSDKLYVVFDEGIHKWGDKQNESYQGYKLPYVSNKKIYIPGGAYVIGTFSGEDIQNTKLYGRGVLSACGLNRLAGPKSIPYSFVHQGGTAKNQIVEGLVSTDPPHFHHVFRGQVHADNLKMMGWWHQTDGIVNGDESTVENCFIKTNDDYIKLYSQNSIYRNNTFFHQVNGAPFQLCWSNQRGSGNYIEDTYIVYSIYASEKNDRLNTAVINSRNGSGGVTENNTWNGLFIDNGCHKLIGLNGSNKLGTVFRNFTIRNIEVNSGDKSGPQNGGSYFSNLPVGNFQNIRIDNFITDGVLVSEITDNRSEDGNGKLWFSEGGEQVEFEVEPYPNPRSQNAAERQPAFYSDDSTPYPLYAIEFGVDFPLDETITETLTDHFDAYFGSIEVSSPISAYAKDLRPDFEFYRYVGKWTVGDKAYRKVNKGNRREILHYWLGTLAQPIAKPDTKIKIEDLYGSLPSTEHLAEIDIWIQIGEEWMKVVKANRKQLIVERGWDNSTATSHEAGAPVLAPTTSSRNVVREGRLTLRHDSASRLRWSEVVDEAITHHRENGAGTWIDILMGNFATYDLGGEPVSMDSGRQWNFREQRPYSEDSIAVETEKAITWIQEQFREEIGELPNLWANNMEFPVTSDSSRLQLLIKSENLPRPLDGFAMENMYAHWGYGGGSGKNFMWVPEEEWHEHLRSLILMGELKVNARPLMFDGGIDNLKFARLPKVERERLILYGYASYLLGVKVEPDDAIYTKLGSCPIVVDGDQVSFHVYDCFKWDIGRPAETLSSKNYIAYQIPDTPIFLRRFENGIVLVNPSDKEVSTVRLPDDLSSLRDPASNKPISIPLTLGPRTGKILLRDN